MTTGKLSTTLWCNQQIMDSLVIQRIEIIKTMITQAQFVHIEFHCRRLVAQLVMSQNEADDIEMK